MPCVYINGGICWIFDLPWSQGRAPTVLPDVRMLRGHAICGCRCWGMRSCGSATTPGGQKALDINFMEVRRIFLVFTAPTLALSGNHFLANKDVQCAGR